MCATAGSALTEIGARTRLLEVAIGDYSYVVNDSEMAYTTVGKFCSIAAMTRINPQPPNGPGEPIPFHVPLQCLFRRRIG
jgi:hypothetical protein